MIHVALVFTVGVLAFLWQRDPPPAEIVWLVIPLLLAAWRWRGARLLLAGAMGFGWAWFVALALLADRLPATLEGRDLTIRGWIASIPEPRAPRGVRFILETDPAVRRELAGLPRRLLLGWYDSAATPRPGEYWTFTVRLKRPRGLMNPGGEGYETWLFTEHIGATGYVRQDGDNARLRTAERFPILRVRARIVADIMQRLRDEPFAGVVAGLAVGHADGIDDAHWEVFRRTGIIHLVSISGLHVTLFAALMALVLRLLWVRVPSLCLRCPAPVAAACGGFLLAAGYALLAGFGVPTQRTLLMLAAVCGAIVLRREATVAQIMALALFAVVLADPLACLAPGFWLSFGGVAVLAYTALEGYGRSPGRRFLHAQWSATIGLAPLLALFFNAIPLAGPVANLLAIPLFNLVLVPLTLAGTALLAVLPAAGGVLLEAAARLLALSWPLFEWFAYNVPALAAPVAPAWLVLAAAAGVLLLLAPRGVPARWLGILLLAPLFWARPAAPPEGAVEMVVLDVGHGLAIALRTRSNVLLYDAGPAFRSGTDAGEFAIEPFFRASGWGEPALLVVSHADSDHAAGTESVLRLFPGLTVLSSEPHALGVPAQPCEAGQHWTWDGVRFELLHPELGRWFHGNDGSCVLKVSAPGGRILLTGDIERRAEQLLLDGQSERLASEVIIVPHHGSRTSSSEAFVEAVAPRLALVSAAYRNRWGLPRPEVVERYRRAGAHVVTTAEGGALTVYVDPHEGVRLSGMHRRDARRLWTAR